MSRSLQASPSGIERAKQALVRKSLTQKAIANELGVASWATVNKFFNGRPVDRFIFQEICRVLDLDWEAIAVGCTPPTEGQSRARNDSEVTPVPSANLDSAPPSSPFLVAVQTQAAAAREALTPRILERIPRRVVREKYLQAIARGVDLGHERVIPIIGPAGYGKSTILGDIYDELIQAETAWVGLVLCSSLSLSAGYLGFTSYGMVASTFAPVGLMGGMPTGPSQTQQAFVESALGQNVCGENRSIVAIAAQLNQSQGRGVLLIDTLDLVMNREFVVIWGAILRQLLAQGTTVVFTCRDHEYNDYLEPTSQRLPGLTQCIDRFTVPNFTTAEIRAAAEAFFRKRFPNQPERGQVFATNILDLSADNRSLRDILENPLLLALLCDLFADEGSVPPDLTVSKLYQRYWQEKVGYSRADQSHFAPLALEKETLCLQIAQRLFELSQTRLYESFYRDELGIAFTPGAIAAYNDLLSEGVLSRLDSGKFHFFHQTLLEYAIAYWLTRQSAHPYRMRLFEQLQPAVPQTHHTYWLPVLRQLLAIVDESEFEQMVSQLDVNEMGIFGAIAYAAVSRDRPHALRQLLPTALQLGENHQRRLRQALAAAPRQLIENTWDLFLTLLQASEHVTAGNTVQLVGALLERWWQSLHPKLEDTLTAIASRQLVVHPKFPNGYDDRGQLFGWLLQACFPLIQASPIPQVLSALRQFVHLFGHATVAGVIQSHHLASIHDQQDLLRRLLQAPVPRYDDVKDALINFVAGLLPHHLATDSFPFGKSWSDVLHQACPDLWDDIQIKAVGRWAAQDQTIFQALLQDYLYGTSERLGRNLKALLESIYYGTGAWLLPCLQQLNPEAIAAIHLRRLSKLLPRSTSEYLTADTQESLAQWFQPFVQDHADDLHALLNVLADASPTARHLLETIVEELPYPLRQQMSQQLLRFQPIETHPPLHTLEKGNQRCLIAVYQRQAQTNPAALNKLIETALGKSNDAAVSASLALAQVSESIFKPAEVLPLLRSPFVGVRVNVLVVLTCLSRTNPLSSALIDQICQILIPETNQTVARHFYDLVTEWVRQQRQVSPVMLNTIAVILNRTVEAEQFEGGMGRSLAAALKVIARSEATNLDRSALSQIVHQFLISIHFSQIKNGESEIIDVLCAMHRLDPSFLKDAVQQDCQILLNQGWVRNVSSIIKTIRKLEGPQAPLLDEVSQRYGDRPDIESLVLEARGV